MFKNPTFRGFLMAVKHLPPPEGSSEDDSPEEKVARLLFNQFDTDGDGTLDYFEMTNLGATFASGVIHDKVENYLTRFPTTKSKGLDFNAFRQMLFPGDSFHIDLDTYYKCTTDEQKARLIFDGVRAAGGMAREHVSIEELQSLFIEWGVPRREAVRMFKQADADNDGKVTFEEWQTHMKPVWKYQYKELRGTLLEVEHIEHRKEILAGFEKSQLPASKGKAEADELDAKHIAKEKEQAQELADLKAQLASLSVSLASKAAPPVAPKPAMFTPGGSHISSEI
jgi:Ca2+-binding EF-hand superfamily protein